MPSIFTTPRTGPDCSTVTLFTSLTNFSRAGESTASVIGPFCRMHTNWPAPATFAPPRLIESMMFAPLVGIEHLRAPVSTTTEPPSFVTLSAPDADDDPCDNVTGPARPAGTTVAKPLHFSEPSGQ